MVDPELHWERVYQTKQPTEVSWYRPHLEVSLELIEEAAGARAHIIDVGAGESTLVADEGAHLLVDLIEEAAGDRNAHIIDVGAGESTLVG